MCYAIYTAARMPWPNQAVAVGLALALAGVYSVSPIKRASQAMRELCALHGPPFNLMRNAAVVGARYGLSCLGCNAALMVAMVLLGMSGLWWAVIVAIVVLATSSRLRYKCDMSWSARRHWWLSASPTSRWLENGPRHTHVLRHDLNALVEQITNRELRAG